MVLIPVLVITISPSYQHLFKRRLSLARVLLKESSILLFDEPERGLNAVQENTLINTLKNT